jgi:peptide/nickel transport system permease protein
MRAYIIRRVLLMIPTLIILTLLIYVLANLLPGNLVDAMLSKPGASEIKIDRAALEQQLGLDAPVLVQYGRWMGFLRNIDGVFDGVLQGNLGTSFWQRVPVLKLIVLKWPITVELGIMGIIIGQLIALPIGVYSALRQDKLGDYIGRSFAILAISVPGFWLATMIVVYPARWWGYMPPIMLIRFADDPLGNIGMFLTPAMILGLSLAGFAMRLTRTQMLEVMKQDYIRTAWAKGLRERVVVVGHAIKNAFIPVITSIGLQLPILVGGTVIIEQIFVLPGMGRLVISAITDRDEPLVAGVLLVVAVTVLFINLLVDLTYGLLDPRIRYA